MDILSLLSFFDFDTSVKIMIGAFIGWNLPQPFWAQIVSAKLKEYYLVAKEYVLSLFAKKK